MEKKLTDLLKEALLTQVSASELLEHTNDNSFLYFEADKTALAMYRKELLPIGICISPSFGHADEYAFEFFDMKIGNRRWVHITKRLTQSWLRQFNLTPAINILWDDEIWENYIKEITEPEKARRILCQK